MTTSWSTESSSLPYLGASFTSMDWMRWLSGEVKSSSSAAQSSAGLMRFSSKTSFLIAASESAMLAMPTCRPEMKS